MNRSLFRIAAHAQLVLAILLATGCTPTQPFFLNESPDLQYYLNTATQIEYPDVDVESLSEATESAPPLTIGNHDYKFWDLTLEECISIALNNAKFFITTNGNAEFRQNVASQFTSGSADQFGSVYDVAIQQSTTQSIPLTVDGNGNRVLPRGVQRSNQIGGVEDALAEFDAQASAFVTYGTTDRVRNAVNSTVSVAQAQGTDLTQQAALSKRFATGGVATLRQQIIYSSNNNPLVPDGIRVLRSDVTALVEAQVQHPLMRNRGTLVNRVPVVLASLNEDLSIADFEIQVRNLVRDVEVAYWNLYVAYRNVSTAAIARNSALVTATFAKKQFELGTGAEQDLAQAQEQYFNFRGRLEAALAGSNLPGDDRAGVYGSERALRELLGLVATDDRLIRPIEEPSLARVEIPWEESVTQMLYLSPELRKGRTVIKQRELEQISAKNQLLPEVNLSLLYRWVGVGDSLGPPNGGDAPAPAPGSSALGELTGGNYQEGAVRLEITPPAIGGRRERARIRGTQLRLQQTRAYLQDAERLLVSQLSDAVGKASTHYQLVQTNAQRWQNAEVEVEKRLLRFSEGDIPVNVVLQSQQRRADAQISYYRALAEYNKSLSYVDYLKGTLLANSNITLAEGPWNQKAYWDALERARERSAGKKLQYGVSRPGVVRQGPLLNAESATHMAASGTEFDGEPLPPGVMLKDAPGDDPMGLDLQPQRDPVAIPDDVPLSGLGDSTGDMFNDGAAASLGSEVTPREIPLPTPETLPSRPRGNGVRPSQAPPQLAPPQAASPRGSSLNGVSPINYESHVTPDAQPQPVRRTPVPPQGPKPFSP